VEPEKLETSLRSTRKRNGQPATALRLISWILRDSNKNARIRSIVSSIDVSSFLRSIRSWVLLAKWVWYAFIGRSFCAFRRKRIAFLKEWTECENSWFSIPSCHHLSTTIIHNSGMPVFNKWKRLKIWIFIEKTVSMVTMSFVWNPVNDRTWIMYGGVSSAKPSISSKRTRAKRFWCHVDSVSQISKPSHTWSTSTQVCFKDQPSHFSKTLCLFKSLHPANRFSYGRRFSALDRRLWSVRLEDPSGTISASLGKLTAQQCSRSCSWFLDTWCFFRDFENLSYASRTYLMDVFDLLCETPN
jgi:hypothetical protein